MPINALNVPVTRNLFAQTEKNQLLAKLILVLNKEIFALTLTLVWWTIVRTVAQLDTITQLEQKFVWVVNRLLVKSLVQMVSQLIPTLDVLNVLVNLNVLLLLLVLLYALMDIIGTITVVLSANAFHLVNDSVRDEIERNLIWNITRMRGFNNCFILFF